MGPGWRGEGLVAECPHTRRLFLAHGKVTGSSLRASSAGNNGCLFTSGNAHKGRHTDNTDNPLPPLKDAYELQKIFAALIKHHGVKARLRVGCGPGLNSQCVTETQPHNAVRVGDV